jgi:hypothetical protein
MHSWKDFIEIGLIGHEDVDYIQFVEGYVQSAGCCEHSNESSSSMKIENSFACFLFLFFLFFGLFFYFPTFGMLVPVSFVKKNFVMC